MPRNKKEQPQIKLQLHPHNKHRGRYNFQALCKCSPELSPFVILNKYNSESINFFDPKAVLALNRALLKYHYGILYWDIPDNYLCPPIPGRADYIHYVADLLKSTKQETSGGSIKCLDIGVGANCIYPIIGFKEHGWSFVGSDIDPASVKSAKNIVNSNPELRGNIQIRQQNNSSHIFKGIVQSGEFFHLSVCNPPFHASASEAREGTVRKLKNLKANTPSKAKLNFGGQNNELWCEGGETKFIKQMIEESLEFADSCLWFTSLVSKETNLPAIYSALKGVKARQIETINMGQGNKKSRIVAWTFQTL